ncbi:nucleotide pyrophosphohydrolase [Butyrivibrio fibrisolvens]|uniref:nucleotide pyrophosphohydrolase n=1 Tax=Butyrivibrio fibrisolvens TaxID=831 RepID=UPI000426A20F|nr:nucleotide pyrophosphohydrolase [Butyrivibrio fibrisolvens]
MADFGINEMLEMQRKLQDKYKDKWEGISPEVGKNKLLWMIGEVGEVIDIVKKNGPQACNEDNPEREHLIEELAAILRNPPQPNSITGEKFINNKSDDLESSLLL